MPANLSEWDAKHRAAALNGPAEPASIVRELLPLLPHGPALDLACGTGRHALLLAARHQPVTAVDGSSTALEILAKRAKAEHLALELVTGPEIRPETRHRHIRIVRANLESAVLQETSFAVILCVHYLQRSLHAQIERALLPEGMLVFETYTRAQLEFAGGPRNSAHLLESRELRTAFPSLELLFYRELCAGQGIATLVAQKACGTK
jgi:SAM-dependent methyltransferase